MSGDAQHIELVNMLVQNLERSSVSENAPAVGYGVPAMGIPNGGFANKKHQKPRKHGSGYEQGRGNSHRMEKDDGTNGYSQFGSGAQYLQHGSNAQEMQGRDREWAEYVQIMNLPVSGVHSRGETQSNQAAASVPLAYIAGQGVDEEGLYSNQDEAHFVQSFVQNHQFLPYQLPGYFQHPGFTSQLYSDGRVFPNQMYPFGAQQYMVAPEEFQEQAPAPVQNSYSYSKPQQNNVQANQPANQPANQLANQLAIQPEEKDPNGLSYTNVGVTSMHDPPVDPKPKPKKKNGPKSWADIANTPAAKNPVQRPKPQAQTQAPPQQTLTAKPEEKPKQGQKKPEAASKTQAVHPSLEDINTHQLDLNPSHARFFVIKSYSEDDIHKAIKYNIWASTDSGNRRLDSAYKESGNKGPLYLFFSVNASGQFCGMAQMLTSLDYEKKCDLWAQDKWNGQFQVKWLFIKDIPNSQLRHIRLENNENKPVTNSRDTQEILYEPGKEMLRIFTSFKAKSSILDDFTFYDKRQEIMKEKKLQPPANEEKEVEVPTGSNRAKARTNVKKTTIE